MMIRRIALVAAPVLLLLGVSDLAGQPGLPLAGFRYIRLLGTEVSATGNPDPAAQGQYPGRAPRKAGLEYLLRL